jgi:hypothetical protein
MRLALFLGVTLLAAVGCATSSKAKLLEKAYQNPERRRELFEANLEVLDRNPEYVDQFFALARQHPPTLERFVENQSAQLDHDPALAAMTAKHLRRHPKGLEVTMAQTLDAAERDGAARRAIANAVRSRAPIATDIIVEEPDALAALGKAMAKKAKDDPQAREHLKTALSDAVSGDHRDSDDQAGHEHK